MPSRRAIGRTDLRRIELLALDVAGLHDVLNQRPEHRRPPQIEAERLHATEEVPLPVPDVGQRIGHGLGTPAEPQPARPFMDVQSPHDSRRL